MANIEYMRIQVIYALPQIQYQVELELPAGSTASNALERSGLLRRYPQIDLKTHRLGVLGRRVKPDFILREGQRLEIYRPLVRDPKQARRERAYRSSRTTGSKR